MITGTEHTTVEKLPSPISHPITGSAVVVEHATIPKSLRIKGEVISTESLFIDGTVEGAIRIPNCRVTIAKDAEVSADITAREVVVFGKLSGKIDASDRVDIRSEASLTGDVTAQRVSIGDGANFHGGIAIIRPVK